MTPTVPSSSTLTDTHHSLIISRLGGCPTGPRCLGYFGRGSWCLVGYGGSTTKDSTRHCPTRSSKSQTSETGPSRCQWSRHGCGESLIVCFWLCCCCVGSVVIFCYCCDFLLTPLSIESSSTFVQHHYYLDHFGRCGSHVGIDFFGCRGCG